MAGYSNYDFMRKDMALRRLDQKKKKLTENPDREVEKPRSRVKKVVDDGYWRDGEVSVDKSQSYGRKAQRKGIENISEKRNKVNRMLNRLSSDQVRKASRLASQRDHQKGMNKFNAIYRENALDPEGYQRWEQQMGYKNKKNR